MDLSKTPALDEASVPYTSGLVFHPLLKIGAKIISYIFHPLFIPVYISWFLIYINPLFPAFSASDKTLLFIRFVVMYTVFPLFTVLIAKGLGFVQSIYLKTQRDRIIPYIACGLYYFWMWYVLKNQPAFPQFLVMLSLAIFLASSAGLIINSFMKISMHGLSLGVMMCFMLIMAFTTEANFGPYVAIALVITGLVSSARLINSDHHPAEVYAGFFVGVLSQLIAAQFV
jgi:hypothetical protein